MWFTFGHNGSRKIEKTEKVQKRSVRMIRGFEDMTYKEMLIEFDLFNLDIRKLRENMRSLLHKNLLQTGQRSIAFLGH